MSKGTYVSSFITALLFGIGLGVAGMTMPTKVIGFLDFGGAWDPSLMWVMGGAALTYGIGFRLITKRNAPIFAGGFQLPTLKEITPRLVIGSAMFGIGWGLGGFCPGPALTGLGNGYLPVVLFVGAMMVGMFAFRVFDQWSSTRTAQRKSSGQALGQTS